MIAFLASLAVVLYVLVPGALYRFTYSLFVPLKAFQRTKTEEVTFAASACLIPFVITLFFCKALNWSGHSPLSGSDVVSSYKTFFAAAYSEQYFSSVQSTFWAASTRVFWSQVCVLACFYLLVFCKAVVYGVLSQNIWWVIKKGAFSKWIANHFLIQNVSEWYFLLTAAMFEPNTRRVEVDILTAEDHLYRGTVVPGGYFLDRDGDLLGILLKDASRFDRSRQTKDKEMGKFLAAEKYWRRIPGANWYIPESKILNLNIRYEVDYEGLLIRELQRLKIPARVTITLSSPAETGLSSNQSGGNEEGTDDSS